MALFSMSSLALKWSYFFLVGSVIGFTEYSNVYMKQLGFSPSQIGLTSLMGIQHLCLPLFGYLGDRFRARKLVLIVMTAVIILTSLAPLLPLVVSFPTCFVNPNETQTNRTSDLSKVFFQNLSQRDTSLLPTNVQNDSRFTPNSTTGVKMPTPIEQVKRNTYIPWLSTLFVFMAIVKALFTVLLRGILSLENVATMTYIKEERARYGRYSMWIHIGGCATLLGIGLFASHTKLSVCGFVGYGYHITFIWVAVWMMLGSFPIPWFNYEYLDHRYVNWTEVKTILCDFHYIIMLIVAFFIGSFTSFQINWEFWYISELSGSPTIMGVAGLIRRPMVALSFYLSGFLIEKIGDLKTIAVSLYLLFISFLAISFIKIPWLILTIDFLQAAAYGLSYTGVTVHFSKAGSKASSAVILGLLEMVYAIGVDGGAGVMGLLFNAIGPTTTLLCYSVTIAIILIGFLAYIYFGKDPDEYEKLPVDSDNEDD